MTLEQAGASVFIFFHQWTSGRTAFFLLFSDGILLHPPQFHLRRVALGAGDGSIPVEPPSVLASLPATDSAQLVRELMGEFCYIVIGIILIAVAIERVAAVCRHIILLHP
jgi:hypothetical protein